MEAIEPISFEVVGSGLDPTDFQPRMSNRRGEWDETHDYILHQSLEKHFKELSRHTLLNDYKNLVDEKSKSIDGYIPSLREDLANTFMPPVRRSNTVYYMKDVIAVPSPNNIGHVYFISKNKNKARNIRDTIIEELEKAPSTFGALGVDAVTTHSGSDFTLQSLRETEAVTSIEQGEMDEFEEQIYEKLEPVSEAFVHNVRVSFDYPQEPEYDIVFSLAPGNTVTIEVEDHSGSDSQPEQSDLIDDPSAESDYINADQAFSICKGISSELLGQFKPKAELTNVDITEKEQCKDIIMKHIETEMVPDVLGLSTGPRFG